MEKLFTADIDNQRWLQLLNKQDLLNFTINDSQFCRTTKCQNGPIWFCDQLFQLRIMGDGQNTDRKWTALKWTGGKK